MMFTATTRWNKPIVATAVVALAFVGLSGCSSKGAASTKPEKPVAHVGSLILETGSDAGEVLYVVGAQRGFFEKNGLSVSVRKVQTAGDATQALIQGHIDAVSGTEIPMLSAKMNHGENVKILGTMGSSDKQFGAVGSSKVTSPDDLVKPGIKVGVTQGSGGVYWLHAYAKYHHLDESKIHTVNVAQNDMPGALRNGDIDAMFSWQPYVPNALSIVPGSHLLAYGGDHNVFQAKQYIVVNQHVYEDPKVASAFLKSMIETSNWVNAHKDESITIVSDFLGVSNNSLGPVMKTYNYDVKFDQNAVDQLKSVYKFMKDTNLVSGSITDWSSLIDDAPLKKVDSKLVTVDKI
jgi:ABC-type nitrate/sulfonate/bicarbonate transport systems, periplasmic components